MPAKDTDHEAVKHALIKAGWTVTHDPYTISFGFKNVFVDLGAERVLGAERGNEKIAIEIKSFMGASDMRDLENALGQYVFYKALLARGAGSQTVSRNPQQCIHYNAGRANRSTSFRRFANRFDCLRFTAGGYRQMDILDKYRHIIREVICYYAQFPPSIGEVQIEVIFDESNDHYELMFAGWSGQYRIHGSVIHIDIRNGKVWIQYDGIEEGVANVLVEKGIPREHIVLAFKAPDRRALTDFAVS